MGQQPTPADYDTLSAAILTELAGHPRGLTDVQLAEHLPGYTPIGLVGAVTKIMRKRGELHVRRHGTGNRPRIYTLAGTAALIHAGDATWDTRTHTATPATAS